VEIGSCAYANMLIEDISNSIFPFGSSKRSIRVLNRSGDRAVAVLVAQAMRPDEGDLTRAAGDFFRECVRTILYFGRATYEIVFVKDKEDAPFSYFELRPVHPYSLWYTPYLCFQYVPENVRRDARTERLVRLDPARIVRFEPPKEFRRDLRRMCLALAHQSTGLIPNFALSAVAQQDEAIGFDFRSFDAARRVALACITRSIGWSGRGSFTENTLEYYSMFRFLKFEAFKLSFRDEILRTLNEVLRKAGAVLGISEELTIEGLPSRAEVDEGFVDLEAGQKAFIDVMKPFLLYG
jgi:hypothetical protein